VDPSAGPAPAPVGCSSADDGLSGGNLTQARRYRQDHWGQRVWHQSGFSRHLHRLRDVLDELFAPFGQLLKQLNTESRYVLDSFPVAVCGEHQKVWGSGELSLVRVNLGEPSLFVKAMPQPAAPAILSATDRLAAVYQLKIHLLGISPQIRRRVLGVLPENGKNSTLRGCVSNWPKNYGKLFSTGLPVSTTAFSFIWQPAKRRLL
jgi:hypothetical protein